MPILGLKKTQEPTLLVGFCVMIFLLSTLSDLHIRFHLGDSASYLNTSIRGYIPDDRSWTYGLIASAIIWITGSLQAIIVLQAAAIAGSLAIFSVAASRMLAMGPRMGAAIFIVCLINPLNLFWTRAIMADALALAACALLLAGLVRPSERRVWQALWIFCAAWLLFSLRVVYVPPVFAAIGCAVIRCLWQSRRGDADERASSRAALPQLLAALSACCLAFACYIVANTQMVGAARYSANHASSRFLVAAIAPVLTDRIIAPYVAPEDRSRSLVPDYDARIAATFAERGLIESIHRQAGTYDAAEPAYRAILRAAVTERPLALLRHVIRQWGDYLDPRRLLLYHSERRYTGTTAYNQPDTLDAPMIDRLHRLGVKGAIDPELPRVRSISLDLYAWAGAWWALVLSLYGTASFVAFLLFPRRLRTNALLIMQVFAFASMGVLVVGSNELITRYLMPLCLPLAFTAACALTALAHRPGRNPSGRA